MNEMSSNLRIIVCSFVVLLAANGMFAQRDVTKFEVGSQFSLLNVTRPSRLIGDGFDPGFVGVAPHIGHRTEPGFGGRLTFNLTSNVALEAEGNLFPRSEVSAAMPGGRIFQGQFGAKIGKRFHRVGFFGKARPGFVRFTQVSKLLSTHTTPPGGPLNQVFTVGTFGLQKDIYFAMDVGVVVEHYFSRRIFTRFDLGDTIIHYREFSGQGTFLSRAIITRPPETRHNLQFSAGVGFSF
jgi:hypothetical protein